MNTCTAVESQAFANLNITWVEENVADRFTLDYLGLMEASEEEIRTAVPAEKPTLFSNAFVTTYVSLKLKGVVIKLCKSVPNRAFNVFLKYTGNRGNNPIRVHVEISSNCVEIDKPFHFWLHYDIYTIANCNLMCKELAVWEKHLCRSQK